MGVWHISTTTRISKAIFFHISKGCRSHTTMKFISSSWYIDIQLDINILTRIKPVFLYLWGGFGGKHTAVESFYNFNLQSSKSHLHLCQNVERSKDHVIYLRKSKIQIWGIFDRYCSFVAKQLLRMWCLIFVVQNIEKVERPFLANLSICDWMLE